MCGLLASDFIRSSTIPCLRYFLSSPAYTVMLLLAPVTRSSQMESDLEPSSSLAVTSSCRGLVYGSVRSAARARFMIVSHRTSYQCKVSWGMATKAARVLVQSGYAAPIGSSLQLFAPLSLQLLAVHRMVQRMCILDVPQPSRGRNRWHSGEAAFGFALHLSKGLLNNYHAKRLWPARQHEGLRTKVTLPLLFEVMSRSTQQVCLSLDRSCEWLAGTTYAAPSVGPDRTALTALLRHSLPKTRFTLHSVES